MRIVSDINTLVSGLLWTGPAAEVLRALQGPDHELLLSAALFQQTLEVVSRKKFAPQLKRAGLTIEEAITNIVGLATMVDAADLPLFPDLRDRTTWRCSPVPLAARRTSSSPGTRTFCHSRLTLTSPSFRRPWLATFWWSGTTATADDSCEVVLDYELGGVPERGNITE